MTPEEERFEWFFAAMLMIATASFAMALAMAAQEVGR